MACMSLGSELRKVIYTANAIENLNREIRRVTKTKGGWPSGKSLLIQLHLSLKRKEKSWHKKIMKWSTIRRELVDTYGERFTEDVHLSVSANFSIKIKNTIPRAQ
ncbi:MAG: putative transposase [Patescibacteria group bacterium]|jgi:putative transposase